MPNSDVRVFIAELRASHKAMEEMQREARGDQKALLHEVALLTKETHRLANVFIGQKDKVDKLELSHDKHGERIRALEDIASSERPMKEIWMNSLKILVGAIVVAIFYTAFKPT